MTPGPAGAGRLGPGDVVGGAGPLAPEGGDLDAILRALDMLVAERRAAASPPGPGRPGWRTQAEHPWRFSSRWWSGPAALRRERPGR